MLDVSNKISHWRVLHIGGEGPTYCEQWRKHYTTFGAMPRKTQEGVSVLSMCQPMEAIEGVGRKVSNDTFWLDDKPDLLAEYERDKG